MRSKLLLFPLAVVASLPAPAQAEVYLTVQQAQKLLFPHATFKQDFIPLSEEQYNNLRDTAQVTQWVREIKAWRVSTGGWFLVDQVVGRDDWVFYAVGLDTEGRVTGIEIMECLPQFDQVRDPAWRRQFVGLKRGMVSDDSVLTISGTTLSSEHIIAGVQRVLVTYDLLLKQRP
jgi:FMN-binding domain